MQVAFDIANELEQWVAETAQTLDGFGAEFEPQLRPSTNARFGDFQVNGVLAFAKVKKTNPRALGETLLSALQATPMVTSGSVALELAGPGFINITLSPALCMKWLSCYGSASDFRKGAGTLLAGKRIVIDFPSPNTAKQMHIGHLRPMVIGESVARLLEFCGGDVIRDNHIGDWGTNFGTLIMMIKHEAADLDAFGDAALSQIEDLYKAGTQLETDQPELREVSRKELVKLQQGDPENTAIWEQIVALSQAAFDEIYVQMDVSSDMTLGESFYREKVARVWQELEACGLAEVSDGALVVFHPEHPRFCEQPFLVRKRDGASNYAATDLATVLYRVESCEADRIIYVTDDRQQDHFQQLFLTTQKWFAAKGYRVPELQHVYFGKILGEDKKPIKTRSGGSVKLKALLAEASERAYAIVTEKNLELPEAERREIAQSVGYGAVKYADLSTNRTQDYVFSWERLLSFEGNTAPYLQYAVARIHSIFRNSQTTSDADFAATASELATEAELKLARKLLGFPGVLKQALPDLRPHHIGTYLYELAGEFSSFYATDKVNVDDPAIRSRRLLLCARTLAVLSCGLHLLGIPTRERM